MSQVLSLDRELQTEFDSLVDRAVKLGYSRQKIRELVEGGHLRMVHVRESGEPAEDSPLFDDIAYLTRTYLKARRPGREIGPRRSFVD